ncbi:MAG TPA: class I SAM-dependent methyltransferase [Ktedonobacterales bacterium]
MIPHHHPLDEERLRRRASFNEAASLYDGARPDYPEALFDDMVALSGIPAGGAVLEIGSGTGKATLPLARRGFSLLGIELGEQMAAIARERLAAYPQARIEVGAFEEQILPDESFDLAVSASAWHWIDPAIGYRKVAQALRPSGFLALLWSHQRRRNHDASPVDATRDDKDDTFDQALREASRQVAPELARAREGRSAQSSWRFAREGVLQANEWFQAPEVRRYTWEMTYDTEGYLRLLDSYSSYRILEPGVQKRLFAALATLIETRFGGSVTRRWEAELFLARRQAARS